VPLDAGDSARCVLPRAKDGDIPGNVGTEDAVTMTEPTEKLVKSKQRVADHGEVFTPSWLVEDMLDLVKDESMRIDSRVLEPACGSGNFLIPVLKRKLATVRTHYGAGDFENRHYALFAVMCTYGIELLADNAAECRGNLAAVFDSFLGVEPGDVWADAARAVLSVNIVQGDALTMTMPDRQPITFPEWGYLGKGLFQRRDFRFDNLASRVTLGNTASEDSLFAGLGNDDLFAPTRTYSSMTVDEIAAATA